MLIGITGRAGAGKDTVAGLITGLIPAQTYHFAGPVKQMALAIDPIVEIGRNQDQSLHISRLSHIVDLYGWTVAKQLPEVRRFLQRLGTEGVRGTFGSEAWVELMYDWWYGRDAAQWPNGVIPDTRFDNEAFAIHNLGGCIIKVIRPSAYDLGDNAVHESERGIEGDYEITNDSSIEDLEVVVQSVLEDLGFKWP